MSNSTYNTTTTTTLVSSSYESNAYQECVMNYDIYVADNEIVQSLTPVLSKDLYFVRCISDIFEAALADSDIDLYMWLLVLSGAIIFLMQTGFAMLCAGCVRRKNVQNTMLKNLLDAAGGAISFYAVGYAFAFGGQDDPELLGQTTFIGKTDFFLIESSQYSEQTRGANLAYWFFQFTFSASAATIIAGTLAERCQTVAYILYAIALSGFVYPVIVHAVWSNQGFLSVTNPDPLWGMGALDFAGGGVVHCTGGLTALIAAIILGPRKGRFYDSKGRPLSTPVEIRGHSEALQLLGTMILWFGCK
jgi:ammonium transporter, Amt family